MKRPPDPNAEVERLVALAKEHEAIAARYRQAAAILGGDQPDDTPLFSRANGETPKPAVDAGAHHDQSRFDGGSTSIWAQRICRALEGHDAGMAPSEIADKLAELGLSNKLDGSSMVRDVFVTTIRNNLARFRGKLFYRTKDGLWSLKPEHGHT